MDRRSYLGTLGAASAGLAGCVSDRLRSGDDQSPEDDDSTEDDTTADDDLMEEDTTSDGEDTSTDDESTDDDSTDDDSTEEDSTDDDSTNDSTDDDSTDEDPTEEGKDEETAQVHEGYETTTVSVQTPDRNQLGTVTAAIADTSSLRYTGLSDTAHLPEDRGMLFVFEEVADRTFVMREMDFGIDIIYADSDGVITSIHHAEAPGPDEDGNDQRYPGRGQYVLEVVYDWTTERDVSEGDRLVFTLP